MERTGLVQHRRRCGRSGQRACRKRQFALCRRTIQLSRQPERCQYCPVGRHNWFNLGVGVDGEVRAIAVGTNGDVYVGGAFTNAGGITVNRIARWNGSAWTSLGSGVSGPVNALVVQGTNLYAAGGFTNAGGITATNLARWD